MRLTHHFSEGVFGLPLFFVKKDLTISSEYCNVKYNLEKERVVMNTDTIRIQKGLTISNKQGYAVIASYSPEHRRQFTQSLGVKFENFVYTDEVRQQAIDFHNAEKTENSRGRVETEKLVDIIALEKNLTLEEKEQLGFEELKNLLAIAGRLAKRNFENNAPKFGV